MEKSHVGLGFHVCPVCACEHDEVVLLDKRLKNTLEHKNFVGWEMCANHKKLYDDDYVALVGIDPEQSKPPYTPASVYRTGAVAHLKVYAFKELINQDVPDNEARMCFVPDEVIDMLQKIPVAS